MNSLMSYGSDDDYEDSSEEKSTDCREGGRDSKGPPSSKDKQTNNKTHDVNYEEVQMDLSEESNESQKESHRETRRRSRDRSRDRKDHHRSSKRDHHNRHRRDRKSRRSSSRDRRRSSRDRSRSRDRTDRRKYSKRYEKTTTPSTKPIQNETNTVVKKQEEEPKQPKQDDRFFMPGITGRFRDQIERRKQLWQKKTIPASTTAAAATIQQAPVNKTTTNGQSKKVWETTTFAQDTDGKVANKFKRLMGIRGAEETTQEVSQQTGGDVLKKQEEMFSSMEQQYEVARTATHTMRGVGLGFGSYQR